MYPKIFKALAGNTILLVFLVALLSNTVGDNFKEWGSKVAWSDYKDTVITGSRRAASSAVGMQMTYKTSDNDAIVTAIAQLDRSKSWVDSAKKSDRVLSHEQYHFNIQEYWCRKFKQDVSKGRFSIKNFKEKLADLQKDNATQCKEMQKQYDEETKHSILKEEQKKWETKIDELLTKLDDFAEKSVNITLK